MSTMLREKKRRRSRESGMGARRSDRCSGGSTQGSHGNAPQGRAARQKSGEFLACPECAWREAVERSVSSRPRGNVREE